MMSGRRLLPASRGTTTRPAASTKSNERQCLEMQQLVRPPEGREELFVDLPSLLLSFFVVVEMGPLTFAKIVRPSIRILAGRGRLPPKLCNGNFLEPAEPICDLVQLDVVCDPAQPLQDRLTIDPRRPPDRRTLILAYPPANLCPQGVYIFAPRTSILLKGTTNRICSSSSTSCAPYILAPRPAAR